MIRIAILIVLLGVGIWASRRFVPAAAPDLKPAAGVPVTAVKRSQVTFTIVAQGDLQGGNTQMLQTPMTGGQPVTITFLRQNGELVQSGDEVVKFDTTEQEFRCARRRLIWRKRSNRSFKPRPKPKPRKKRRVVRL